MINQDLVGAVLSAPGNKDRRTMYIRTNPSLYKIRLDQALTALMQDEK